MARSSALSLSGRAQRDARQMRLDRNGDMLAHRAASLLTRAGRHSASFRPMGSGWNSTRSMTFRSPATRSGNIA